MPMLKRKKERLLHRAVKVILLFLRSPTRGEMVYIKGKTLFRK
jgi:hypothetical protein